MGATREAPAAVLRRLARFHLRDFVRGEPQRLAGGGAAARAPDERGGRGRRGAGPATPLPAPCVCSGRPAGRARRTREQRQLGLRYRRHAARARRSGTPGAGRFVALRPAGRPARGGGRISTTTGRTTSGRRPWGSPSSWPGTAPRTARRPHTIYHREYFAAGGTARDPRGERSRWAMSGPAGRPAGDRLIPELHRISWCATPTRRSIRRGRHGTWGLARGRPGAGRPARRPCPARPRRRVLRRRRAEDGGDAGPGGGAARADGESRRPASASRGARAGWEGQFRETVQRFFDPPGRAPAPGGRRAAAATERFEARGDRTSGRARRGRRPGARAAGDDGRGLRRTGARGVPGHAAGAGRRRRSRSGSALRMPDVAVLELAPGEAPRMVIPFGTLRSASWSSSTGGPSKEEFA